MASISTDSAGRRRIQFVDKNGKRKAIRLGEVPLKWAEGVMARVEDLATAQMLQETFDRKLASWLAEIGGATLHQAGQGRVGTAADPKRSPDAERANAGRVHRRIHKGPA